MLVNTAVLVRNAVLPLLLQPLIYELGRAPAARCWRGTRVSVCARVCTCTWTSRGMARVPAPGQSWHRRTAAEGFAKPERC